jgi:Sec-independent protein translocase protein TatA
MFTILLVLLAVVVWGCTQIARAAEKVVEGIGDPQERVAKINGAMHHTIDNAKPAINKAVDHAKHAPEEVRDAGSSVLEFISDTTREARNRVGAQVKYRQIKRQQAAKAQAKAQQAS